MSYNGQMTFGLKADYDALPDVGALAAALREAIDALLDAAGLARRRRRRGARRRAAAAESLPLRGQDRVTRELLGQ